MAWTYSGDPASSEKDYVRFLVGDTDTNDQLVQDEEIEAVLADEGNVSLAAAIIAEAIAGKYSRLADISVGKTSISYSQRAASYLALATRLRKQSKQKAIFRVRPYAGGISRSDKENVENNDDRVKPIFEKDLFKNPYTTDPISPDDDEL